MRGFSHFTSTCGVGMNAVGEEFWFINEGGVHVDNPEFHFLGQFIEALDFLQYIFSLMPKLPAPGTGQGRQMKISGADFSAANDSIKAR